MIVIIKISQKHKNSNIYEFSWKIHTNIFLAVTFHILSACFSQTVMTADLDLVFVTSSSVDALWISWS